jgi:hypothetical protein
LSNIEIITSQKKELLRKLVGQGRSPQGKNRAAQR